jgi:predicted membrane protein (TIGR00267 family)
MHWIGNFFDNIRSYNQLVNISEIARRYFAMNAFDGILTIIGVLMGNLTAGVDNPRIIISTGLATCTAMGISGLWGAYLTESAERKRELEELNNYTLTNLKNTRIGRASRAAVVVVSIVDGLSPFLAALIVLVPFFFTPIFPTILWTYYTSLGMALLTLFALGMFLGSISSANLIVSGFKTISAGAISIFISYLLGE